MSARRQAQSESNRIKRDDMVEKGLNKPNGFGLVASPRRLLQWLKLLE